MTSWDSSIHYLGDSVRVPPEGPSNAAIMLLGESPGTNEWKQRRPFVGKSGDTLNDALRACGIHRSDVYITNVIKNDLPPRGDKKKKFFFHEQNKKRHPTQTYLEGIAQVLQEIEAVKPNVIVPMGNYALWALMQHSGIMKWRGSILESKLKPGQKVVPAIHPAYFHNSFQWHLLPLLEWDMARAVEESATPEINLPEYNITVDPAPAEMEDWIERCLAADRITVDTEWYAPNRLAYSCFAVSETDAVVVPNTSMHALRMYKRVLSSGVPIIMQNAAFDVVALHRQGIDVDNVADDTMIAFHCCWTDLRKKGLDMICSVLTRQPYYKEDVEFVGEDDELGQYYCGTDCVVTHKAMQVMRKNEFPITHGDVGYDITMSAMPYFIEASNTGILIDNDLRVEMKELYIAQADEIERNLAKTLGYTINCRSHQQVNALVHDYLLPTYGIKRTKRTSRQEYLMDIAASTDVEAVQLILGAIIRVRQNRNIVSRYLHDGIVDRDGRVRTNWNLAGTRSGRFSSTIPWWPGLALQTVPRDARRIFIPDPGYRFIGFDYRQAEAYVVAQLTYNHELLDDLKAGIDVHAKLAAQLFDIPFTEVKAEIRKKEKAGRDKDEYRPRFMAKKARHAFNYVEGPNTFTLYVNREWIDTGIGINRTEGASIRRKYLKINDGLEPWWDEVKAQCLNDGYIDNSFGRRRMVLGRITDQTIREMVSFYPQSTIADYCTQAIVKCCKAMPWAQVMLHMHDGALFQVPEDRVDESYEIMMNEVVWPIRVKNDYITVPADGKIGDHWT